MFDGVSMREWCRESLNSDTSLPDRARPSSLILELVSLYGRGSMYADCWDWGGISPMYLSHQGPQNGPTK